MPLKRLLLLALGAFVAAAVACGEEAAPKTIGESLQEVETGRKSVREVEGLVKSATDISPTEGAQEFVVTTSDDFEIAGTYYRYDGKRSIPLVLMLHEAGGSREDWTEAAEYLYDAGFGVLNIDFRGHGKSTSKAGATVGHDSFSEDDWQNLTIDARAVLEWVQQDEAIDIVRIGLIGSKTGANVAVKVLYAEADLRAAFLVSPNPVYNGIDITAELPLREEQNIFIMTGNAKPEALDFTKEFYDVGLTTRKRYEIYDTALEGLDLVREMWTNGLVVVEADSSWGTPAIADQQRKFDKVLVDFVIRNI